MRDTTHIYKDTMREDAMELGGSPVRAPTQQELKISEPVAAYKSGDIYMIARIDLREEERRK